MNVVRVTSKASDQPAHLLNIIWSFLAQKDAAQTRLSLHLALSHVVGNHMSRLKYRSSRKKVCPVQRI